MTVSVFKIIVCLVFSLLCPATCFSAGCVNCPPPVNLKNAYLLNFSATASLIRPLSINLRQGIRFPVQMAGVGKTVASNGPGITGSGHDASFEVHGQMEEAYVISGLEPLGIMSNDGDVIKVSLIVLDSDGSQRFPVGVYEGVRILDKDGADSFQIRGMVTLTGEERPGIYSGTREIFASYY
ncbi:MAG: hypothetical protein WCQ47_03390 [bacterium]